MTRAEPSKTGIHTVDRLKKPSAFVDKSARQVSGRVPEYQDYICIPRQRDKVIGALHAFLGSVPRQGLSMFHVGGLWPDVNRTRLSDGQT